MTSGAKFRAGTLSRARGARAFHLRTSQPASLVPAQALQRIDVGTRCTATGRHLVEGAICDQNSRPLAWAERAAPLSHGVQAFAAPIPCVRKRLLNEASAPLLNRAFLSRDDVIAISSYLGP